MIHPAPNSELTGEARKRLMGLADDDEAHWSMDPREGWAVDVPVEDLRTLLSAYDRQAEEIERLRGDRHFLLETLRQIDGVVKDGLDPSKLIAVGLEYGDMDAARARQGGHDHG